MRRVKDGLTKAERYNRNMENIFAYAEKVNKNRMNWLRQQGVSEDEIQNAKANTGLGKNGLGELVLEVARGKGDKRLNSDIFREVDDLEAIRNVKDGCGRKVKDGYSNNSDYFGDWYGKGKIDFDAIINPEDDGDLYMVKIWGGSGYVLDVYLVKAYDEYDAIDIVFEWSYENEGANNIIFDYNYLSELCLEDYEDEYWYGKGEGKPSDKMSYEEFEDEWFDYYISSDNGLYARSENFFVDEVPQDMIERNRANDSRKVRDSYDDVEQDIANNKGISALSIIERFLENFSFVEGEDTLIDFTTDEVIGKTLEEKAKNVLKEFETCLNYAVKGIKPKCNVKVNYKSNDVDSIFFDMVITCGDKTRKESGNISVGAYPDEWCFDIAEDINDMIE